jgi:hypothetical protein
VDLNGNTSITYWMGKTQPSDPDWTYYGAGDGGFLSEEACWKRSLQTWDTSPVSGNCCATG